MILIYVLLGLTNNEQQKEAHDFYKEQGVSVEIMKDDILHKARFFVTDKVMIQSILPSLCDIHGNNYVLSSSM